MIRRLSERVQHRRVPHSSRVLEWGFSVPQHPRTLPPYPFVPYVARQSHLPDLGTELDCS